MTLPKDADERKKTPIFSGVMRYFPRAIAAVAHASYVGNEQHSGKGVPLQWVRAKSGDEHDALLRHLLEAGTMDTDGVRHSAKVAWRALAALEKELEAEENEGEFEALIDSLPCTITPTPREFPRPDTQERSNWSIT